MEQGVILMEFLMAFVKIGTGALRILVKMRVYVLMEIMKMAIYVRALKNSME